MRMAKNTTTKNELTGNEKATLKSILEVIMEDSDLRKGFRAFCQVSVPEMRKMRNKLDAQLLTVAEPKG
jgi:hypothetical protein